MFSSVAIRVIIGVILGAVIGFGVYRLVGCSTGACPLTSNPWVSTILGAVMGVFIAVS